jgi:hypothetical protein
MFRTDSTLRADKKEKAVARESHATANRGYSWRKTANYPPQRTVLKVIESVALRVPFVTLTTAVTFASSG